MGLSVAELAALTPFQFELKCKGYIAKQDNEEMNFRRLAYIVFLMGADPKKANKITIDDIWPTRTGAQKSKEKKGLTKRKVNSLMDKFRELKMQKHG